MIVRFDNLNGLNGVETPRKKYMKSLNCMFLTVAVAMTTAMGVSAGDKTGASPALGVLSTVSSAELPAKAAELVAQADAKTLKQTTIDVVRSAVGLNPAAAPAIVGSVAKASPDMAATATATAVALVPNQVVLIARFAATAAPAKAGAIVEAICRVLPSDYKIAAQAVAEIVPGASREILAGIEAALPELKGAIDQALASYQGSLPSVNMVLAQVDPTDSSTGTIAAATPGASPAAPASPVLPRGPSVGPPATPPSGTPTVVTPGAGGVIPSGGTRGYSAP